jgi:hypothetical protein
MRMVSSFQSVEDSDAMVASGMERGVHDIRTAQAFVRRLRGAASRA